MKNAKCIKCGSMPYGIHCEDDVDFICNKCATRIYITKDILVIKTCTNCRYLECDQNESPCDLCENYDSWVAR